MLACCHLSTLLLLLSTKVWCKSAACCVSAGATTLTHVGSLCRMLCSLNTYCILCQHIAAPLAYLTSPLADVATPLAYLTSPLAHVAAPLAHLTSPLAHVASSLVYILSSLLLLVCTARDVSFTTSCMAFTARDVSFSTSCMALNLASFMPIASN